MPDSTSAVAQYTVLVSRPNLTMRPLAMAEMTEPAIMPGT